MKSLSLRWRLALIAFFSVMPSAFAQSSDIQPGDQIRVTADSATVMAGEAVLGAFPKGTELTIDKVQNGWGLIRITVGGEAKTGWIKLSEVSKSATSTPGGDARVHTRRSGSNLTEGSRGSFLSGYGPPKTLQWETIC